MKNPLALILSVIMLLCSCSVREDIGSSDEGALSPVETESSLDSPSTEDSVSEEETPKAETTIEKLYDKAKSVFGEYLSSGEPVENAKVKLYFDESGEGKLLKAPDGCEELAAQFLDEVTLRSRYVEICLDSRFSDGIGVSCVKSDSEEDTPKKMPTAFNFADGVFDGGDDIETCPPLKQGESLAEFEYSCMNACINQLNRVAAAGAQAAGEVLFCFDEQYTKAYGTAHTVLCSDKNGIWRINRDYNNGILTDECTEKIIAEFNKNEVLSKAENCTVQLMFYMEQFVGVSANYSADEKYFATYDVPFWESWKAPYEESYHDKSFLFWSGTDGCLKGENGRLCSVGTYCTQTDSPLGVYIPVSVMGDWKITRVGEKPFSEYAQEASDGYYDYTQLVCKISESRLFLYGGDLEVSLYDIEKNRGSYEITYHTAKHGELFANDDGTLTLFIRHHFTGDDMSLPLTLERYSPKLFEEYTEELPPQNERLSTEEYAARDTEKYSLLDLSGERRVGEEIPDPNVLSEYRRYVAAGGEFTVEIYTTGADRLEYELCSFDGKNGYQRSEITRYDSGDDPLGWEDIFIDGKCYESYYKLDRYDLRKYECRRDEYGEAPYVSLLSESEYGSRHFVKAYKVTIGETEYVCEEWNFDDIDNAILVYSVDGEIKGYEGNFYGRPVVSTITRLEKQADTELIRVPDEFTAAATHDYD